MDINHIKPFNNQELACVSLMAWVDPMHYLTHIMTFISLRTMSPKKSNLLNMIVVSSLQDQRSSQNGWRGELFHPYAYACSRIHTCSHRLG
jgi:hypothetical protein